MVQLRRRQLSHGDDSARRCSKERERSESLGGCEGRASCFGKEGWSNRLQSRLKGSLSRVESSTPRRQCTVDLIRAAKRSTHFRLLRSSRRRPLPSTSPTLAQFDWFFGLPWFLRPSRLGGRNSLILGLLLGSSLSLGLSGLALYAHDAWKRSMRKKTEQRLIEVKGEEIMNGVEGLIGEPGSRRSSCRPELALTGLGMVRKYSAGANQLAE